MSSIKRNLLENTTEGPWEVHHYLHCSDQLWLGIGKKIDHSGPICNMECTANLHNISYDVTKAKETCLKRVAECKYLITDEKEQIANAQLVAEAPVLAENLDTLMELAQNFFAIYLQSGDIHNFDLAEAGEIMWAKIKEIEKYYNFVEIENRHKER